jgi:hypothetical protein
MNIKLKNNVYNVLNYLDEKSIEGDIVELGVYKGELTKIVGTYLLEINSNRVYHGFDTFSGYMSEDIETQPLSNNKAGLIENQNCGRWNINSDSVIEDINNSGFSNVCKIYVGDLKIEFKKAIESKKIKKIACLIVDCNAYLPSYVGMNLAYEVMDDESVIFIDEHTPGGESMALEEFCKNKKLPIYDTSILKENYKDGPSKFCIIKKRESVD